MNSIKQQLLARIEVNMTKQGKIVWLKARCPICGLEYEYAEAVYEPKTCDTKECVQKQLHPELKRRRL